LNRGRLERNRRSIRASPAKAVAPVVLAATLLTTLAVSAPFDLSAQDNPFDIDIDAIVGPQAEGETGAAGGDTTDEAGADGGSDSTDEAAPVRRPLLPFSIAAEVSSVFSWSPRRTALLNPGDTFAIDSRENETAFDVSGTLSASPGTTFFADIGATLRFTGDDRSWDTQPELEPRVDELGLTVTPGGTTAMKVSVGRIVYQPGHSYAFNTFTDLDVAPTVTREHGDLTVAGVDMISVGLYGRRADVRLIYAPGFPVDDGIDPGWALSDRHRGAGVITASAGRLTVSGHGYAGEGDTRGAGVSASREFGGEMVMYSDVRLGTRARPRITAGEEIAPGFRRYEDRDETETVLSGSILGASYASDRLPDVIAELYVDSGGYDADEFRAYIAAAEGIREGYDRAPADGLKEYYRGAMGGLLGDYDPFHLAQVLLFLRVSVGDTDTGNVETSLVAFLDPVTSSALVTPTVDVEFRDRTVVTLSGRAYLGAEDSLFGHVPYRGSVSARLTVRY
jgi:hypothetical protein